MFEKADERVRPSSPFPLLAVFRPADQGHAIGRIRQFCPTMNNGLRKCNRRRRHAIVTCWTDSQLAHCHGIAFGAVLNLIEERADQQDPATIGTREILILGRVWHCGDVETRTVVTHRNSPFVFVECTDEVHASAAEPRVEAPGIDCLVVQIVWVVADIRSNLQIAVDDGVHHRLTECHSESTGGRAIADRRVDEPTSKRIDEQRDNLQIISHHENEFAVHDSFQ